jgi:tRNA pseudouridine55 synthase
VLVDKPDGVTSHDVVQHVRRALRTKSAGHTGTLDPFATGLLVVLVGRATRLARFVESQAKTYLATARLGFGTTTDDLTGEVSGPISPAQLPEARIRDALDGFRGVQLQRPPQFSAKRVGGERSYRKARRGEPVELAEVSVTVHRIDLVTYVAPEVTFRLVVSAGTYVRAVARDLGERLGVGAHLTSLRREAIGELRVEHAVAPDQVGPAALLPPEAVLGNLPVVRLSESERQAVQHGRAVLDSGAAEQLRGGAVIALLAQGDLVAVARSENGWLQPTVVLRGS